MSALALSYNDTPIRVMGERLNLTDMWKAAASPSGRAPNDWLALTSTKEFLEHVELIAGNPGNLVTTKTGRNGGTSAHWQIGLAYAKYLSPEFHMWCNSVVRERMEGRPQSDELTRRMDGILRMLSHKVTGLEKASESAERLLVLMAHAIEEQDQRLNGLIITNDPRSAACDYHRAIDVLIRLGAEPKGRRALALKAANRMDKISKAWGVAVKLSPENQTRMFSAAVIAHWEDTEGRALVRTHNARALGQAILPFPANRTRKK